MLGEFLEISLSTPDLLASVRFYEQLGFQQASVGDTWPHPYAVLSDGHLHLGLHRYTFTSPSLTFVLPELRAHLANLEADGVTLEFSKTSDAEFNEAGFFAPDTQMIALLEARTFSPRRQQADRAGACGYFSAYRLAVHDYPAAQRFWETLGFVVTAASETPPHCSLSTRGLNVTLWESPRPVPPALVFVHPGLEACAAQLDERGPAFTRARDLDGQAMLALTSPEGMRLLIRSEDF